MIKYLAILLLMACLIVSCDKGSLVTVPDNDAPYYDEIPTLLVENYVNRIFIDMLGREPLNAEMDASVAELRADDLSMEAREALILKLQTDTVFREGDSTYRRAYYNQLYEKAKAHLIEGASIDEINVFVGNTNNALARLIADGLTDTPEYFAALESLTRLTLLISADNDYHNGAIDLKEVMRRMIDNAVYDFINMNSFNFVNATFDNLLYRYPTQIEFDNAYQMVENNAPATLFATSGSSKDDYIAIILNSLEFYEGMLVWAYQTLLARNPTTAETVALLDGFYADLDFQKVQRTIMISDEYANFD